MGTSLIEENFIIDGGEDTDAAAASRADRGVRPRRLLRHLPDVPGARRHDGRRLHPQGPMPRRRPPPQVPLLRRPGRAHGRSTPVRARRNGEMTHFIFNFVVHTMKPLLSIQV